jgi:hypothetical protein
MRSSSTNKVCPYCRKLMNKIENDPLCASKEHLVPNTLLITKRKNGNYDFKACRKCNSEKSELDSVLGVIAQLHSDDEDHAIGVAFKEFDKPHSNHRYLDMIATGKKMLDGNIALKIPINGMELAKYCTYLAQGAYFMKKGFPLSLEQNIILFDALNNSVSKMLELQYLKNRGSNPFRDLEKDPNSIVIMSSEALIHFKNNYIKFIFHDRFILTLKIVRNNNLNRRRLESSIAVFNE